MKKDEPLVHIATAPNEPIANMWSGILKEEGIHCLLRSADPVPVPYLVSFVPYEIYVLSSKAEVAKEILAPFLEAEGNSNRSGG